MIRILLVEDQRDLAEGLRRTLAGEGYDVEVTARGDHALELVRARAFDLMILDLMLADTDGFRVLSALRREGHDMPVLVLTARSAEVDALAGFRLGADDYVTKPFRLLELLARIRALLRRARPGRALPSAGPERYEFGDVGVSTSRCDVTRGGRPVALRPKEYELLLALLRRDGDVASRAELLREVWGYEPLVTSRTVDTHILELRRKLEPEPAEPRHILTVRARGYRLVRGGDSRT